jgi:hypothetical protein
MEQKIDSKHIDLNVAILEKSNISKRFGQLVNALDLNANKLSKILGGSTAKYYKLLDGEVKTSYDTTETLLLIYPEISAEWLFRGKGEMFIVPKTEDYLTQNENKIQQFETEKAENQAEITFLKQVIQNLMDKEKL